MKKEKNSEEETSILVLIKMEMLISVVVILTIAEFVIDTIFAFKGIEYRGGPNLDNLTSLIIAMIFYALYKIMLERVDNVTFKNEGVNNEV